MCERRRQATFALALSASLHSAYCHNRWHPPGITSRTTAVTLMVRIMLACTLILVTLMAVIVILSVSVVAAVVLLIALIILIAILLVTR